MDNHLKVNTYNSGFESVVMQLLTSCFGCDANLQILLKQLEPPRMLSWRTLVDLLHEHNTPQYKGRNGWSSESWNRMVMKFHEQHPYVSYTKLQIQEKEKELKREYRMLKEARQQSGVSWNAEQWRIEAEEELWDNLKIVSSLAPYKFLCSLNNFVLHYSYMYVSVLHYSCVYVYVF